MKMSDAVRFSRESLKSMDIRTTSLRALEFYNQCIGDMNNVA